MLPEDIFSNYHTTHFFIESSAWYIGNFYLIYVIYWYLLATTIPQSRILHFNLQKINIYILFLCMMTACVIISEIEFTSFFISSCPIRYSFYKIILVTHSILVKHLQRYLYYFVSMRFKGIPSRYFLLWFFSLVKISSIKPYLLIILYSDSVWTFLI